ncbi:MAG: hypothetical protein COU35_00060 [Candidatus Magasanikbacteria bacterium CG10_big_fil_rev_8_21_14_0_10_47_10]|uniref:Phosphatidylglycerol--prolipoprotein diacylglyceryl transferase n=1 Tax=Candidatus Magasanikbacteria bacterium CG10_big_fil_rev_8_21_14_0_10_47_10 TaxID=1974652 RepID=A0A2H0TRT0_9BACT|nr:MAG: hypothetical protein COU35_00060 [Candidatus Magasanikbacteria bacterium CG10_big_fil_rev_8_21_14_0_10_47_10]
MIPWFEYHIVQLGPIPIQVWGFWVATGIVVATMLLARQLKKQYGIDPVHVTDIATYLVVAGFLGARVFHIVLYEPAFYASNPLEIIKIWHGGLSSFGGFAGALVGLWIFKKRKGFAWLKKISFIEFVDQAAQMLLLGWMIGRIGCVMIHDHPGIACDCVFALNNPNGPRLDMALLEIIGLLPLATFFVVKRNKKFSPGMKTSILLVYYGVLRFGLDFLRARDVSAPDARYFGLTPAQYFSIVMAVSGVRMMWKNKTVGI